MNCDDLSYTGLPLAALLTLGGVCLIAGLLLLIVARSRRGRTAAIAIALLLGAGLAAGGTGESSAQLAQPACTTITQTSPLNGLAPSIAPAPITGRIVNDGPDNVFVTAITVSIGSVTKAPDSIEGNCDASDYILLATTMPVDRMLGHGDFADFAGASIGFNDKSTNQNACQGAVVGLRYDGS
jgi:hypothetical protein